MKGMADWLAVAARVGKIKQSRPTLAPARPVVVGAVARVGSQLARQGVQARGSVRMTQTGLEVKMSVPRRLAAPTRRALNAELRKAAPAVRSQLQRQMKDVL